MAERELKNIKEEVEEYKPSFYHILYQHLPNDFMPFPAYFLKHLSDNILDNATLKLPTNCCTWKVRVSDTSSTGMCLTDGWSEFLKDNSLGNNEFLLFTFEGNMCFTIQIFDMSAYELDYTTHMTKHKPAASSTSISNKKSSGRPRKFATASTSSVSNKRHRGRPRKFPTSTCYSDDQIFSGITFKSKFPNFYTRGRLHGFPIPTLFSRAHLPIGNCKMVLRNSRGQTWDVEFVINNNGRHYTSRGWTSFWNANTRKDRNGEIICIFELVSENVLQVHMFPIGSQGMHMI